MARIWRWIAAGAALLAMPTVGGIAGAQTARDHGGNRIEQFRQIGVWQGRGDRRLRNCTEDHVWCAELVRDADSGPWTLLVVERRRGPFRKARRHRFVVPPEMRGQGRSVGIWQEIVREAWAGALVGLELWHETGERPGFFSFQRRLLLLRVPREDGGVPAPVLEALLSGHVEEPVCNSADDQRDRRNECLDQFTMGTLFTLVPSLGPVEPPGLIMVAEATTMPGRRSRADGPVLRAPVERTDDDDVRDPACSYTRSYNFDAAQGRYVPDAPLPACRDYLEP